MMNAKLKLFCKISRNIKIYDYLHLFIKTSFYLFQKYLNCYSHFQGTNFLQCKNSNNCLDSSIFERKTQKVSIDGHSHQLDRTYEMRTPPVDARKRLWAQLEWNQGRRDIKCHGLFGQGPMEMIVTLSGRRAKRKKFLIL